MDAEKSRRDAQELTAAQFAENQHFIEDGGFCLGSKINGANGGCFQFFASLNRQNEH